MSREKVPKTFRSTLLQERRQALDAVSRAIFARPERDMLRDRLYKRGSPDLTDEVEELIQSYAPIEIEKILGIKLPIDAAFAPVSVRVAEAVMVLITLKLQREIESELSTIEAIYLSTRLTEIFEFGADPTIAFNRPKSAGRKFDFKRDMELTLQFCRLVAIGEKRTYAYSEIAEKFSLDLRHVRRIIKKNEGTVTQAYLDEILDEVRGK